MIDAFFQWHGWLVRAGVLGLQARGERKQVTQSDLALGPFPSQPLAGGGVESQISGINEPEESDSGNELGSRGDRHSPVGREVAIHPLDDQTDIHIDGGAQVRTFVVPNVALAASLGLAIVSGDADFVGITGQLFGSIGATYFF